MAVLDINKLVVDVSDVDKVAVEVSPTEVLADRVSPLIDSALLVEIALIKVPKDDQQTIDIPPPIEVGLADLPAHQWASLRL